jgi:hypothetical protein
VSVRDFLFLIHLFLQLERMLVEVLLQFLVRKVNAQLFKAIGLKTS